MGRLVDGSWTTVTWGRSASGDFERELSTFRSWIGPDSPQFQPEAGRYHLFVSHACPWAHRTMIFRALTGLDKAIGVTVVSPLMFEEGWVFDEPEPLHQLRMLRELYVMADPNCTSRVTVPVLWDTVHQTIVNNESSEIIRIFNSGFEGIAEPHPDYYPEALRAQIDEVNNTVYENVNNGVYRCGFATSQTAYASAFARLFNTLEWLEERLGQQRYLVGDQITEADWRLFTTLVRFDSVYVGHFKCNKRTLASYPNLWSYCRELYQVPKVAETVHFDHIKDHYYRSHLSINPTGIVPQGPSLDWWEPHGRDGQG